MSSRHKGRECAIQILYQLDTAKEPSIVDTVHNFFTHFIGSPEVMDYTTLLVKGVRDHLPEIDELIQTYSDKWRLSRMNRVDRNILRLSTYELLYSQEVPTRVILDEAVELAKRFGDEHSSAFINGLSDAIAKKTRKGQ